MTPERQRLLESLLAAAQECRDAQLRALPGTRVFASWADTARCRVCETHLDALIARLTADAVVGSPEATREE